VLNAVLPRINEIISGPSPGLMTISMFAALWTASSAVEGYRTVLNNAYHVGTPPAYIWRRLMSVLQLLLFSFLILVGMVMLVFAPLIIEQLGQILPAITVKQEVNAFDEWIRQGSILLIFLVIVMMYHVLPNIRQNWRAVLPGALLTLGGWMLVVQGFRFYLDSFDQVNLIYGSLGGVIAVLLFFYLLNIVFIIGAEFNYQLLDVLGTHVEEKEYTGEKASE
jgi:membrane protein